MIFIHKKAHVDEDVSLGNGTKIWQFASVTRGAILGKNCRVSPFVMLDGSSYGDECVFSAGFAAGPGFRVMNRVFFGPGSLLVNDLYPTPGKDRYEEETLRENQRSTILICDDAIIGSHSIIMPGVTIGEGAAVSAGAKVNGDVPAFCLFTREGKIVKRSMNEPRMRWAA